MRATVILSVFLLVIGCSPQATPVVPPTTPPVEQAAAAPTSEVSAPPSSIIAEEPSAKPEPKESDAEPTEEEVVSRLLKSRLDGRMQHTFGQFANMFLVMSHLNLSHGVGLMSKSRDIAKIELQSPFPQFYHPTLREFLDAIALQTFSEWQHDPTGQFITSEVEIPAASRPVIFEFTASKREKPFEVTLADGWKSIDKGNWVMLVPPSFAVGLDVYEMGTYSADDEESESNLFEKVRAEVALEWAQRVFEDATADNLKPAQVGPYPALHFDKLLTGQNGKQIRWRHWVCMVENKCYFIVSTIIPDLENTIYPDVEKMVASFRVKPALAMSR